MKLNIFLKVDIKIVFRVWAGIVPVEAGMSRHEPVRAGPGRFVPEPVPAEPAQARAGRCLSLPFGA